MKAKQHPSVSNPKPGFLDRVPLSAKQSLGEEIANSITHGTGVGLSIAALVILVVFAARQSDAWKVVSFSIYGATMIALYLASTLYHAFPQPRVKAFFRILDHSSIFLLIAGMEAELTDRFGPMPEKALWLLMFFKMDVMANQAQLVNCNVRNHTFTMEWRADQIPSKQKVLGFGSKIRQPLSFDTSKGLKISIEMDKQTSYREQFEAALGILREYLAQSN